LIKKKTWKLDYMDDLKFIAAVVVLSVAALAFHITSYKWRKEDAEAQA